MREKSTCELFGSCATRSRGLCGAQERRRVVRKGRGISPQATCTHSRRKTRPRWLRSKWGEEEENGYARVYPCEQRVLDALEHT